MTSDQGQAAEANGSLPYGFPMSDFSMILGKQMISHVGQIDQFTDSKEGFAAPNLPETLKSTCAFNPEPMFV